MDCAAGDRDLAGYPAPSGAASVRARWAEARSISMISSRIRQITASTMTVTSVGESNSSKITPSTAITKIRSAVAYRSTNGPTGPAFNREPSSRGPRTTKVRNRVATSPGPETHTPNATSNASNASNLIPNRR